LYSDISQAKSSSRHPLLLGRINHSSHGLRSALHRGNLGFPSMALEHFLKEIVLAVTPSY